MPYFRRAIIVVAVLCMLPMAAVILSAVLATLFGCELKDSGVEACAVLGVDFSGLLSALFTTGWMALLTLPLLIGVLASWGLAEAMGRWRRRRKERQASRADSDGGDAGA